MKKQNFPHEELQQFMHHSQAFFNDQEHSIQDTADDFAEMYEALKKTPQFQKHKKRYEGSALKMQLLFEGFGCEPKQIVAA